MTLWEINEAVYNCIDRETGEIDTDRLEELEIARNEKIENIGLWIKNLKADSTAINSEVTSLNDRKKAIDKKIDNLTKYLANALKGEKFETPKVSITHRKSKSVEVVTEEMIPDKWFDFKTEKKLNKKACREAIENGEVIDGVTLMTKDNLQIK